MAPRQKRVSSTPNTGPSYAVNQSAGKVFSEAIPPPKDLALKKALQLRKNGTNKVLPAGMSANLCTGAHMRELIEDGFEVAVVKDAPAAARHPDLVDG